MAKSIDLSGLRKQPLKKKTPVDLKEEAVNKIHSRERVEIPEEIEEPQEPVKRITIDLPASLHTKLKLLTVSNETTIRSFVVQLIEDALE